jgi:hypothetical protein
VSPILFSLYRMACTEDPHKVKPSSANKSDSRHPVPFYTNPALGLSGRGSGWERGECMHVQVGTVHMWLSFDQFRALLAIDIFCAVLRAMQNE